MIKWLLKRFFYIRRIVIEFTNSLVYQKHSRAVLYNYNDNNPKFTATIFYNLFGRIVFSTKEFIALLFNEKVFKKSLLLEGFDVLDTHDNYNHLLVKTPLVYKSDYILDNDFCIKIESALKLAEKRELVKFDKTDEWDRIAKVIKNHFFKDGKIIKKRLVNFREDADFYQEIFNDQFGYLNIRDGYKKSYLKAIDLVLDYHRSANNIDKCILASSSESYAGGNKTVIYRDKRVSAKSIFHSQIVSDLVKNIKFDKAQRSVILDIGSGYGGLTRILSHYTPNSCHILLDLPETLILTSYFIKYNFPTHKVALLDDIDIQNDNFDKLINEYDFIIIPPTLLSSMDDLSIDLVLNSASFGFMQDEYLKYYLSEIDRLLKVGGYFYSLNKEYIDKWGKGFFHWNIKSKYITHLFEFNSRFSYPQWLGQKIK